MRGRSFSDQEEAGRLLKAGKRERGSIEEGPMPSRESHHHQLETTSRSLACRRVGEGGERQGGESCRRSGVRKGKGKNREQRTYLMGKTPGGKRSIQPEKDSSEFFKKKKKKNARRIS